MASDIEAERVVTFERSRDDVMVGVAGSDNAATSVAGTAIALEDVLQRELDLAELFVAYCIHRSMALLAINSSSSTIMVDSLIHTLYDSVFDGLLMYFFP